MIPYPETINNDWPTLFREYPEVYDAFASFPYQPGVLQVLRERFDLAGKTVLDVGAGGGQSALPLAPYVSRILCAEPEAAMRAIGERRASERGARNVAFLAGAAGAIPLAAGAVDVVMAITAPLDVTEALRVVRTPGLLVQVDITPVAAGRAPNVPLGRYGTAGGETVGRLLFAALKVSRSAWIFPPLNVSSSAHVSVPREPVVTSYMMMARSPSPKAPSTVMPVTSRAKGVNPSRYAAFPFE